MNDTTTASNNPEGKQNDSVSVIPAQIQSMKTVVKQAQPAKKARTTTSSPKPRKARGRAPTKALVSKAGAAAVAAASYQDNIDNASIKEPMNSEQTNEYDSVLGEAQDLLQAAAEAQALGRLKMSNTYLLLLHVRLIGLGKRFDRAIQSDPSSFSTLPTNQSSRTTEPLSNDSSISTKSSNSTIQPLSPSATSSSSTTKVSKNSTKQISDDVAMKLANFLPKDIELDGTMMEHLAHAAMKLHNERTGKTTRSLATRSDQTKTIAWNSDEHARFMEALEKHGPNVTEISRAVGTRIESEVRAHLRNVSSKEKVHEQLDNGKKKYTGGKAKRPPSKAVYTDAYAHFDAKMHLNVK